MSADADNEHFCDGLAEELLNALSKIDDLKVAARTSAFSFKGKSLNVSEIAARLNVNHILEGSVRRSGTRLRISVQLVNASDGFHLWSNRYDREMRDIFDVQDEITLAVVGALKLMLFGAEKAALLKRSTDDAAVHELFLKGRYYSYRYSAEGWTRAIEFFQRAIDMQPDYAPAHAGMATCYGCLWFFGLLPAGQTIPHCKAATHKALDIDGTLANAHLSLAMTTFFYDWEWEGAEQAFRQSIALKPNDAEALSYYALFLAFEGRTGEALDRARPRARNRSALAAHQYERRLDLLRDRPFRRSVGPGGEDDRDRAGFLRRLLAEGRDSPDRGAVCRRRRGVEARGLARWSSYCPGRPGVGLRPRGEKGRGRDPARSTPRDAAPPIRARHRHGARVQPARRDGAGDRMAGDGVRRAKRRDGVSAGGDCRGRRDDPLNRLGSEPRVKDLLRRMSLPQ